MNVKTKVAVAFIVSEDGALGGPPAPTEWFAERKSAVTSKLSKTFPDIEFSPYDIKDPADVNTFLKRESGSTGYLIFVLNGPNALMRPILYASKPTIIIAETYGGAGDLLLEYPRARESGMPVIGFQVRDVADENILSKVKFFDVIKKLQDSRTLFVVPPSGVRLINVENPLSIDLYSSMKSLQSITGVVPIILNVRDFVERYYRKIGNSMALPIADRWIRNAAKNLDEDSGEIEKAAKLYIAMKEAVTDYRADAIALDCIDLRRGGFLDAWPCLGYMELWNDNIVPVCEGDPYSAAVLLTMKYLANRPGFISDPSPDDLKSEVVYYHCYAPTKPFGQNGESCPYVITPAHLGAKHASVYVELPIGKTVTAIALSPEEKALIVHTAETINNELSSYACAVKLVGKTNTRALAKNWRWRSGWHRVIYYGDWRGTLRDLAALLGLDFVEEDLEVTKCV